MINRFSLLLTLSVLLLAGNGWGATYYIDQTGGNDANPGTSTDSAWKTISKVNRSSFSAGDSILFKRGESWQEKLGVPSSGSAGNPITFGAYGIGASPVIYGGVTIPSQSWTANDPVGGVWSYKTYKRHFLYEDSVPLKHASSSNCADGNWFYSSGKVYYKPTSGTLTDHVVELYVYNGIDLNNNSNITIDGISFTKSYYGISNYPTTLGQKSSYITVRNCTFTNHYNALAIRTDNTKSSTIMISNNTFDYNGQSIFVGGYGPNSEKYYNNTDNVRIYNNTVKHCSEAYRAAGYDWSSASDGVDVEGIGVQNLTNSNIYNNTISGVCRGIFVTVTTNRSSYNNNIYKNYVDTTRFGVMLGGINNTDLYNNKIYYNIVLSTGTDEGGSRNAGVVFQSTANSTGSDNKFYNNTVYGSQNNVYLIGTATDKNFHLEIKNNIFSSPTSHHIVESPVANIVTYDKNLYYPAGNNMFVTGSKAYSYSNWKAIDGRDVHSVSGDPKFVNAGKDNYALLPSSPAINAGTDVGLTSDFLGNPVPFGSAPDIGAYEYISSSKVKLPPF